MATIPKIWSDDKRIYIQTENGKIYAEKFADYPLLRNATDAQRKSYTFDNLGIHWYDLNEDFSYSGFMKKDKEVFVDNVPKLVRVCLKEN